MRFSSKVVLEEARTWMNPLVVLEEEDAFDLIALLFFRLQ
jgi:hypothetical protein